MLALLLSASVALPTSYEANVGHAYVAISNDRIVDGHSYTDGSGVVGAGFLFAHQAGFLARSELSLLRGNGSRLPDANLLSLESAAGWHWPGEKQRFAIHLVDYRLLNSTRQNYQGVSFDYRYGNFSTEVGFERDRPYISSYRDTWVENDQWRLAGSWSQPLQNGLTWELVAGALHRERMDKRPVYVGTGLAGHWRAAEWQFAVYHARHSDTLPGDDAKTHWLFRVALPYRLP